MLDTERDLFFDALTRLAAYYPTSPNLVLVAQGYFEDLQPFALDVVDQALKAARRTCQYFPLIPELLALADRIRRETAKVERQERDERKRLTEEQDAKASGLSPAERRANIEEALAVLNYSMGMNAATPPEPHARPRVLHPAYREKTTDDAARKEELRQQLAQVQQSEETVTHA